MDQLACINAFIMIVDEGSLRAAAKRLHQTDAAVSKKLSKLEDSLNVILLERGHGKLKLTDIGQQYYAICKEATEKLSTAKQLIYSTKAEPIGELKVCCAKYNVDHYIIPKLAGFFKKYPKIQLTLSTAERIPDFSRGEADILFGISVPILGHDEHVSQKKMGQTRDVLCATPQYFKKRGKPKKPKDLLALDYICHNARPFDSFSFADDTELQVQPFLRLDDHEMVIKAALENLGYIYTKEYMIEDYLKSGELVEIFPQKKYTPIYVYYRYQTYPDPKIRAFLEYFL